MYDIITIGSATRDLFAKTAAFDVRKNKHLAGGLEACLPLGAKIDIKDLIFDTGGGATNTGAAFANFGMKTAAVCRLGYDFGGKEIIRVLKEAGVETKFITYDKKTRTAYSIILLTEMGERTVLVYRGASKTFGDTSIPWKNLNSHWFYVSSLGGNLKLLNKILNFAKKKNIKVGWNPGGQEIKMGFKKLKPFTEKIDVLIMNEEEAMAMMSKIIAAPRGQTSAAGATRGLASSAAILSKTIQALRPLPRRALVITQGGQGATAANHQEILHAPSSSHKAINTTGAGDAFSAGFIAGLWKWNDLSLALRLGILNSGHVVAQMGAKAGLLKKLPNKKQLLALPAKTLN